MINSLINIKILDGYRNDFIKNGIELPLRPISCTSQTSLLSNIPPPPSGQNGWPWTEEVSPEFYSKKITWPKISIVIPTYNQVSFIEQTIRSVLLQNYPNLELIIIDGGSDDGTLEILNRYNQWISFWQHKKDRGQGHAINLGFSLSSGEIYAWINSDDYYLKFVFHKIAQSFLTSDASFIYGYAYDYEVKNKKSTLIKVQPHLDFFSRIPTLIQPACFWLKKIHKPIWEDLSCALDYELWLRLVIHQKRKLLRIPLCVINSHLATKTHNPSMKIQWENDHQLICSTEAHGSVPNWKYLVFFNKLFIKILRLFGYY